MFRTAPIEVVLAWPTPNYDHPETRGSEVWWASGIFLLAATICVATRLFTRIFVRHYFGVDDALVVLGFICSVAVTAFVAVGTHSYDWDRHLWDVPMSLYSGSAEMLYYSRIAWGLAASFTRLSVLSFYYRLLGACTAPRHFYWANHALTAATIIMLLYYLFSGIFACTPISGYWSWPTAPGTVCFNDGLSFQVSAIINTTLEAIVATLPLMAISKLNVNPSQRISVIGVLCLGYFVALAGAFRTLYIFKVVDTFDLTWWAAPQWICSEVENDVALICACAAPLRPVAGRIVRKLRGLSASGLPIVHQRPQLLSYRLESSMNTTKPLGSEAGETDTAREWITQMSRTIDLEGIAADDFGYTVQICGPTKKERRQLARQRVKANLDKSGLTTVDVELAHDPDRSSGEKKGWEINTRTVGFEVRHSFHAPRSGSGNELDLRGWGASPAERSAHADGSMVDRSESIENLFPQVRSWDLDNVAGSADQGAHRDFFSLPIQRPD